MRIAIVRLTSLGDIIFCMAALQVIRRRFPDCTITWFADSKFADILDHNPDLEGVVKLNLKGLKKNFSLAGMKAEYAKVVRKGSSDLVIDMHGMLKSAAVASMLGKRRAGFHKSVAKEPLATFLYTETYRIPADDYAVFRFASLAASALGFTLSPEELREPEPYLFAGPEDHATVAPSFSDEKQNVVLVPGSSVGYKNYPKEKYLAIARALDARIVVCHGSDDELEVARYLAEGSANVSVLPRLSLNQLKAAIGRADLVIGGDTGPTHMAWACGVPSITLYGATRANCVYPGPACRTICSASEAKLRPDKNDLSIREIEANAVRGLAEELLAQGTRSLSGLRF